MMGDSWILGELSPIAAEELAAAAAVGVRSPWGLPRAAAPSFSRLACLFRRLCAQCLVHDRAFSVCLTERTAP